MNAGSPDANRGALAYTETVEADPRAARPATNDFFEALLDATSQTAALGRLDQFLEEHATLPALRQWLRQRDSLGRVGNKHQVALLLSRDIARLDGMLNRQLNAVLHHPKFQQLEASWRNLRYLVEEAIEADNVKIRVLSASWEEVARDAERAIEFDQSQIFRKVYTDEFDTPGGEPFGLLIGDYQLRHLPSAEHPVDDVATLGLISQVAAASFAPFIAGADPALFGLDSMAQLDTPMNLSRNFEQLEYLKWRRLREQEDSRFLGLIIPRVLARRPYGEDSGRVDEFCFQEDVAGLDRNKYLWGNAGYAFASVVIRAFSTSGWLADIRGVQQGQAEGGLVTGLPVDCFSTDAQGIALKSSTEVAVVDALENELANLGFMSLCDCVDTEFSAFYACPSIQKPKVYDDAAATRNARMSAMLQYMLCVSRFAHYVKVIVRDKIGSTLEASEVEDLLYRWLQKYVTSDAEASLAVKAQYPLREARVEVRERPGKPGNYQAVVHLRPHFQLDELSSSIRLVTELSSGGRK